MTFETTQLASPVPRTFAEFPFDQSWHEIAVHARRLNGATHVGHFGDDHEQIWLRFMYMGEDFCIQDGGERLKLSVDDGQCPESILHEVQRHFAPLLSPALSE